MNLGRYRLEQPLDASRDGVAFAAWDTEAERPCEVRVLAAARASSCFSLGDRKSVV